MEMLRPAQNPNDPGHTALIELYEKLFNAQLQRERE